MLILVGPSASGKTEVVKKLISDFNMKKMVTYTTRPKRIGEIDGEDYHFLDRDDFIKKIDEDFFLEYVVYNGNYYGTAYTSIERSKVVILEPKGLSHYLNKVNNLVVIYLSCAEDELTKRMIKRGDSSENIHKRLKLDKEVFTKELELIANLSIDTSKYNVSELTKKIYNFYIEEMKKYDN